MFKEIDWKFMGLYLIPFTAGYIMAHANGTLEDVSVALIGSFAYYGVAKWWGLWYED